MSLGRQIVEEVGFPGMRLRVGGRYLHHEDGPIIITDGQFWGLHGLSNFWYWTVEETGETKHGYGGDWPELLLGEIVDSAK